MRRRRMFCSPVGVMKSGSIVKPGTGVLLMIRVCVVSASLVCLDDSRF